MNEKAFILAAHSYKKRAPVSSSEDGSRPTSATSAVAARVPHSPLYWRAGRSARKRASLWGGILWNYGASQPF